MNLPNYPICKTSCFVFAVFWETCFFAVVDALVTLPDNSTLANKNLSPLFLSVYCTFINELQYSKRIMVPFSCFISTMWIFF